MPMDQFNSAKRCVFAVNASMTCNARPRASLVVAKDCQTLASTGRRSPGRCCSARVDTHKAASFRAVVTKTKAKVAVREAARMLGFAPLLDGRHGFGVPVAEQRTFSFRCRKPLFQL